MEEDRLFGEVCDEFLLIFGVIALDGEFVGVASIHFDGW